MIPAHWQSDVDLQAQNTLALPGRSLWYARPDRVASLVRDVQTAKQFGINIRVLGLGSNVILQDFDGLTLTPALDGIAVRVTQNEVQLKVAAGVDWAHLVHWCCAQGYHGLENLAMIPGSVGAAPVQNIGAYGLEIGERLSALEVLDIATGEVRLLSVAECDFGYRQSRFRDQPNTMIILAVYLQLGRHLQPILDYSEVAQLVSALGDATPAGLYKAVCQLRTQKLPALEEVAHAGSFFHNPSLSPKTFQKLQQRLPEVRGFPQAAGERIKVSAAQLIAACGWKGRRLGAAAVSKRHALVVTNPGGATAADICALAEAIQKDIADAFAVHLQLEPVQI